MESEGLPLSVMYSIATTNGFQMDCADRMKCFPEPAVC